MIQSFARTESAEETETPPAGSFSAYTTVPSSTTIAYLAVLIPIPEAVKSLLQPMLEENLAPGSLRPRILLPAPFAFVQADKTCHQNALAAIQRAFVSSDSQQLEGQKGPQEEGGERGIKRTEKGEGQYICIIGRDDTYDVDSFVLEFLVFFDIRREMLDLTSRRKRPWNSKQHNFLPHEFLPNQSRAQYPSLLPLVGSSG